MKLRLLLLMLLAMLGLQNIQAQTTTVSLGTYTGQASTYVLLSTNTTMVSRYSRTMSIYEASEIIAAGGGAGNIISLAWDKHGAGEYTTNDAYIKVYLKHKNSTTWSTVSSPQMPSWDLEVANATEVYTSSTYSIPTGTGWKELTFDNPFTWNGVDNIVIFVEWDRSSLPSDEIEWGRSTNAGLSASRVGGTALQNLQLLTNGNRPLVQLTFDGVQTPPDPPTITDLEVSTVGNVPAVINTNGGTLQLEALVLPVIANQDVIWSTIPVTGQAAITNNGLVIAEYDGTVWAKATSVGNMTISDSILIDISNQIITPLGVIVSVENDDPAIIDVQGGTLQLEAEVLPQGSNQYVNWSITNLTGQATISSSGLVTAVADGTVSARASTSANYMIADSIQITISNQTIVPNHVNISIQGNEAAEVYVGETLQLVANVSPNNADQSVQWDIENVTGQATISNNGLITGVAEGVVLAKASSTSNPNVSNTLEVNVLNEEDVSIDQLNIRKNVSIYPNPFKEELLIEFSNTSFKGVEMQVTNVLGQLLYEESLNSGKIKIDTQKWNSGVYILTFSKDGKTSSIQVVKP